MPPLVIAHRGNSSERPENTRAAFESALDLGAPLIELDVHLTWDGRLVVLHDDTLERTTNGAGRVAEKTLAELRTLSAGFPRRFGQAYAGERVPTLAEVLELARGRARVLVEIKDSAAGRGDDRLERALVSVVKDSGLAADVALIGFDRAALAACRSLAPELRRGLLAHHGESGALVAAARALECALLLPERSLLTDELCARARSAGLGVATWVVDEPEELAALERFDLDGVGSNRPGALLRYLASRVEREKARS